MRARVFWRAALAAAFALVLAGAAAADTLTLKDGRVIRGKYVGGTADAIQLEVNGAVQTYDVRDVQSLSRDANSPPPPLPDAPLPSGAITVPAPPRSSDAQQAGNTVTVPAGTRILVRMIDTVDSEKNRVGDRFRASLETNLEEDGWLLIRRNAEVYGRLANVQGAGRISGHAELKLELTGILVQNNLVPIVTGDYEQAGKGRGGNTAKKAVGGAALGAIIGALAGGGRGAAIGAGAGAAAGTTINIITKGEKVKVPSETLLEFRLDAPLTLTPEASAPR
jgi:hypothetical protein